MLKKVYKLLQPAPYKDVIKDKAVVSEEYKYWRIRICYSLYIGYVFYYFTRKSYTFAMPYLIEELDFSKSDLGIVATVIYLTYAVSKFLSGVQSDKSNPRYFMAFGLIATGILNIFFGLSSSVTAFAIIWGINGWFQAWGWPACTKQLTHWYARRERGLWWSVTSTSHNLGGALIPVLAPFCAEAFGWQYAMIIPGIMSILVGVFLIERMRDIPQTLGLPSIEEYKGERDILSSEIETETVTKKGERSQKVLSVREILLGQVLSNKYIWILSISYFLVYVVRTAVNDWGMMYLCDTKDYSKVAAGISIFWFELGGFLGVLASGWGSDYFFKGKRIPYILYCGIGLCFTIPAFYYLGPGQLFIDSLLLALIGFFVFGPQMLVGLAAAEFVSKKAASTSNGFVGCWGYLGAACTGYPLGKIIDIWGWYGCFAVLLGCSLLTLLVMIPLMVAKPKKALVPAI